LGRIPTALEFPQTEFPPGITAAADFYLRNPTKIRMKLKVVLREDPEDGGYNVSCPALLGCHSQGETKEDALENIKDAIQGCLEVLNEKVQVKDLHERVVEIVI